MNAKNLARSLALACLGMLQLACAPIVRAQDAHEGGSSRVVHPMKLGSLAPTELGSLVHRLITDLASESVNWDYQMSHQVAWWQSGAVIVRERGDRRKIQERQAMLRVLVDGSPSTVRRKSGRIELAWTVAFQSDVGKSKPDVIQIGPGLPDEPCFGPRYARCTFQAPIAQLRAFGLSVDTLCSRDQGAEQAMVFRIAPSVGHPVWMIWNRSEGSGGVSTDLELTTNRSTLDPACLVAPKKDENQRSSMKEGGPSSDVRIFDQRQADDEVTLRILSARTEFCMLEAAQAMLRMGSQDEQQILNFQVSTCGGHLLRRLRAVPAPPTEEEALSYVVELAYGQLQRALRR